MHKLKLLIIDLFIHFASPICNSLPLSDRIMFNHVYQVMAEKMLNGNMSLNLATVNYCGSINSLDTNFIVITLLEHRISEICGL